MSRRGANLYAVVCLSTDAPTPIRVKVESDDLADVEGVRTETEFSLATL